MTTAPAHLAPTHISVTFQIVTPDHLRKIIFKLSRSTDSTSDKWSIQFELDERDTPAKPFELVASLDVDVDLEDHPKAAATSAHGMDADQQAQALVAADTAKDVKTGDAEPGDDEDEAKGVIKARNPKSPS